MPKPVAFGLQDAAPPRGAPAGRLPLGLFVHSLTLCSFQTPWLVL